MFVVAIADLFAVLGVDVVVGQSGREVGLKVGIVICLGFLSSGVQLG